MKIYFSIIIFVLLVSSCTRENDKDDYLIINLISNKIIESQNIKNTEIIAFSPDFMEINIEILCDESHSINTITNLKIDLNKIRLNNKTLLVKEVYLKNRNHKFNHIFSFSKIYYNDTKTNASVVFSKHSGRLNGISVLICLNKKNDIWYILTQKVLSIS